MLKWLAIMIGVCVIAVCAHSQSLQFVEETIDVQIGDKWCLLTGTYTFRNHDTVDASWSVFYPLLNTPELPFPDSLSVNDTSGMNPVPFAVSRSGIGFQARTPAQGTSTFRIVYRQPTPAGRMEYILTTTREWRRALEQATFTITIPDSLQPAKISLPYDHVEESRNTHIYYIHKTNFLPKENLIISWR